jgi:hypothetical protein
MAVVLAPSSAMPQSEKGSGYLPSGGYLTWEEAVARHHPAVAQFQKPEGMPVCPPPGVSQKAAPSSEPAPDGPVCFARPEDQGLVIPDAPSYPADGLIGPPGG